MYIYYGAYIYGLAFNIHHNVFKINIAKHRDTILLWVIPEDGNKLYRTLLNH